MVNGGSNANAREVYIFNQPENYLASLFHFSIHYFFLPPLVTSHPPVYPLVFIPVFMLRCIYLVWFLASDIIYILVLLANRSISTLDEEF